MENAAAVTGDAVLIMAKIAMLVCSSMLKDGI